MQNLRILARKLRIPPKRMADYREAEELFERISKSEMFSNYRTAFEAATGMALQLHRPDSDFRPAESSRTNAFCRILNEHNRCPDCAAAAHCIGRELSEEPRELRCFAGLSESAVPILAGRRPIAYLMTGQVFTEGSERKEWEAVKDRLEAMEYPAKEIAKLEKAWKNTATVADDQYEGMVGLLSVFAGQLSELAEHLILESKQAEPKTVVRARQYVSAHLADKIDLADVSSHVGMSPYHFCKVFKQSTGLTFKQYLTRRRVEWAKCRLRKPDARVTEIAYDVGFGSLSQFNRSFSRLVGLSPSDWREREFGRLAEAS